MAGFDGIVLSFGDGADSDTVRWLLRPLATRLASGVGVRVNGTDYLMAGMPDDKDGFLQLRLQPVDPEFDAVGDPILMRYDDVETLLIY